MDIGVVGVNHNLAPISIREGVSFTDLQKIEAINYLLDKEIEEIVILSTCNRSEIYIQSPNIEEKIKVVEDFYQSFFNSSGVKKYLFSKTNREAIEHIYNVTAGLDSIVLGEDQILGQVKDSYLRSKELKVIKGSFDKLFSMAISCGKEFKTESKLYEMPVSYSSIAAKKALEHNCKNILILGFGKMAELTFKYLVGKMDSIDSIFIVVRNIDKANTNQLILKNAQYITTDKIKIIPLDNLVDTYEYVDGIICCTSSPTPLVMKKDLPSQKTTIFDLSLPINVEASCSELKNIYLYYFTQMIT